MKKILLWLILGTKGGLNRAKIIKKLKERPYNLNQLSKELDLNYRTVSHHISKLEEMNIVESYGKSYGKMYFLTDKINETYEDFEEILNQVEQ
ncbi:winged helix-turn-helix domain-containing protein [Methanosphaera sp. WGK6]|uniref:ArsR/SmtB family transcription factor n=1 Tax=Methanosphaera sp. WGK6 TaxID=1561964 RepID=UPI00084CA5CF|nr:winged helix-turn-helix domain-containing protein [Methanosphaera sp. WGK6]OED29628.1 ArsR family transcriptional regulator [Methanosphaera sp. WGK6]